MRKKSLGGQPMRRAEEPVMTHCEETQTPAAAGDSEGRTEELARVA